MFKRLFRRRARHPEGSPSPSLTRAEVNQLKGLVESDDFDVWLRVLETTAEGRATKLLAPLSPEDYHFERGVLFAYVEMHGAAQRIINRLKELDEHERKRSEQPDASLHWGSPNWADFWRGGAP